MIMTVIDDHGSSTRKDLSSHVSAHGGGACCCEYGTREFLEVLWSVVGTTMEELAQRLQQLETRVGQQRAVIEHQQGQLMQQ